MTTPRELLEMIDRSLGLTKMSPNDRKQRIETLCEQIGLENVNVRQYSNACAVTILVGVSDERIALVMPNEKDQDIIAIVAKLAGVEVKRLPKQQNLASNEALRKLFKKD